MPNNSNEGTLSRPSALRSVAVGIIAGFAGIAGALCAFFLLYALLPGIERTQNDDLLLALAVTSFVVPLVLAVVIGFGVIIAYERRHRTRVHVSALVAGLFLGMATVLFVPITSAVNDCKFDVGFPLASDPCD